MDTSVLTDRDFKVLGSNWKLTAVLENGSPMSAHSLFHVKAGDGSADTAFHVVRVFKGSKGAAAYHEANILRGSEQWMEQFPGIQCMTEAPLSGWPTEIDAVGFRWFQGPTEMLKQAFPPICQVPIRSTVALWLQDNRLHKVYCSAVGDNAYIVSLNRANQLAKLVMSK